MRVRFAVAIVLLCFTPLVASHIAAIPFPQDTMRLGSYASLELDGLLKLYSIIGYLVLVVYLGVTGQEQK